MSYIDGCIERSKDNGMIDGRVSRKSECAGSPLIASMDEYISDLENGNHISWDGDDFFGLLNHLKEVRSKMANATAHVRDRSEAEGT